jgi:hypothetical protein
MQNRVNKNSYHNSKKNKSLVTHLHNINIRKFHRETKKGECVFFNRVQKIYSFLFLDNISSIRGRKYLDTFKFLWMGAEKTIIFFINDHVRFKKYFVMF